MLAASALTQSLRQLKRGDHALGKAKKAKQRILHQSRLGRLGRLPKRALLRQGRRADGVLLQVPKSACRRKRRPERLGIAYRLWRRTDLHKPYRLQPDIHLSLNICL